MTDLLLLCILIMQVAIFHSTASSSGRYAKAFDFIIHRPSKYIERGLVSGCRKTRNSINRGGL